MNIGYKIKFDEDFPSKGYILSFKREADLWMRFIKFGENFVTHNLPLLFRVTSNTGTPLFQIFDQSGYGYFDENNRNSPIRLKEILECPNRKIWLFILDMNRKNYGIAVKYAERIKEMKKYISSNDKVLVIVNKIDQATIGNPYNRKRKIMNYVAQEIKNIYPRLLSSFKNNNPITQLWKPLKCDIILFSSGYFSLSNKGQERYLPSPDIYPIQLWNSIKKYF